MNVIHHSPRVLAAAGGGVGIAIACAMAGTLAGVVLGRLLVRWPEHPTWPEFVRSNRGARGLDGVAP